MAFNETFKVTEVLWSGQMSDETVFCLFFIQVKGKVEEFLSGPGNLIIQQIVEGKLKDVLLFCIYSRGSKVKCEKTGNSVCLNI